MRTTSLLLFWIALGVLLYTYVVYPLAIAVLARWRPRPARAGNDLPPVTVLIAAYDEEHCIAAKIANTLALDYPADLLDVLVVADGSTDATPQIVGNWPDPRVRLMYEPGRRGKAAAIGRAWPRVTGDVVLFTDANTTLPPGCLRKMVRWFADPQVGGVSGAKRFTAGDDPVGQGEGLYWRYEAWLKRCDSAIASVMGAPGEVWAARARAYQPCESDILLDDFVASLRMVAAGWRVLYEPDALATETPSASVAEEWERRARNAAGGWQAIFRLREMWRARPLTLWQYLSHRALRWTLAPLALPVMLVANMGLLSHPGYVLTLLAQMVLYGWAGLGGWLALHGKALPLVTPLWHVCLLHAAALAGGWRYLTGRQSVLWRKVR